MNPAWIAVDIGAESGRVIRGELADGKLELTEVHRFPNTPKGDRWDLEMLLRETKAGIAKAGPALSVGVDTWGVDYVRINRRGKPLNEPYQYRDPKNPPVMDEILARVGRWELYSRTGTQFLPFNTLFQLHAGQQPGDGTMLMIPDYIHYELTDGEAEVVEWTNALSTQLFNPVKDKWETELLAYDVNTDLPEVVQPGSYLGPYGDLDVIAPCTHDTASAIVAVPMAGDNSAWISSGTWSIVGIETPQPVINADSLRMNFTNEGSYGKQFRVCKNCAGMWLVQQCRAAWDTGQSYAELAHLAEESESLPSHFDPDRPEFLPIQPEMPSRIFSLLMTQGTPRPETHGQMIRLILESLAMKYRYILEQLEELTGRKLDKVHVVGGGSQNDLLNHLTADITGRTVIAGPAEATATGNLLVQMIATGHLANITEARQLVKDSFETRTFEPSGTDWADLCNAFKQRNNL